MPPSPPDKTDSLTKHLKNIFETGELDEISTCAKFAQVRQEGKRQITREIIYYNLDMILSVGYRVNSRRGTKFRI
ncbi:MAG: virulence RhuM family protein [Nitrospirae bacterium]|nr:virulence RhuM family protein [Nitrospirota bacterium]